MSFPFDKPGFLLMMRSGLISSNFSMASFVFPEFEFAHRFLELECGSIGNRLWEMISWKSDEKNRAKQPNEFQTSSKQVSPEFDPINLM